MLPFNRKRTLLLAAFLALAGCRSARISNPRLFYANRLRAAASDYERRVAVSSERDRTVYLLESGLTHLTAGDLGKAEQRLSEAGERMGLLWGEGQEDAVSLMGEESDKEFKGEPFEQSFCYLYSGLLQLSRQNLERAKTYFLASLLCDRTQGSTADFALPLFLEAVTRMLLGEDEEASHCLSRVQSACQEAESLVTRSRSAPWNAIFVIDCGEGPRKQGSGDFETTLSYTQQWSPVTRVEVQTGSEVVPTTRLGWTFFQAAESGPRVVDRLNRREGEAKVQAAKLSRDLVIESGRTFLKSASDSLSSQEAAGLRQVGAAQAVMGTLVLLTSLVINTGADVRGWTTLPDSTYVGLGYVSGEVTDLQVQAFGRQGQLRSELEQRWTQVPVEKGLNVYYLRLFPQRRGGSWMKDRWGG